MGVSCLVIDDIHSFPCFPLRLLAAPPCRRPPALPRLEAAHHRGGGEPQEGGGSHPLLILPYSQVAVTSSSLQQKHKYNKAFKLIIEKV